MTTARRRAARALLAILVVTGLGLLGPVQDANTWLSFLAGLAAGAIGAVITCAAFLGTDRTRP